jgi:leucyl-tRNA synthetase
VQVTIKKVTEDLQTFAFNTAVAALMELSNALHRATGPSRDSGVATMILLLAPLAPHLTEELWHRRGGAGSVHQQSWPAYDAKVAAAREVTIVIQVDGKVRDRITAAAGQSQADLEKAALSRQKVKDALNGAKPKRVIVVPDRIVSIVTR